MSHTSPADLLMPALVRMVHSETHDEDQILVSHMVSSVEDLVLEDSTGRAYQVVADEAVADPFLEVLRHVAEREAFAVAVDPEG